MRCEEKQIPIPQKSKFLSLKNIPIPPGHRFKVKVVGRDVRLMEPRELERTEVPWLRARSSGS